VAKLNTDGKVQWVVRNSVKYGTVIWSIDTDAEGNSYITGNGTGKLRFGDINLKCGILDIIIAKVDPNGKWEWVRRSKNKNNLAMSLSVTLDKENNPYISGTFQNETQLGKIKLKSLKGWDMVVAKLDKTGKWLWAKQGKGLNYVEGYTVTIDKEGNVILTGVRFGDAEFGSIMLPGNGERQSFIGKISYQ
jgi:hypothetical protein